MGEPRESAWRPALGGALIAGGLGLLAPIAQTAGRLAFLGPVIALPLGLVLCTLWRRLAGEGLPAELEKRFGRVLGKVLETAYLLWGLLLLAVSARRYVGRLVEAVRGENARWFLLAAALLLCLWLGRGDGSILTRAARLFFPAALLALGAAVVLALPGLDWRSLWPPEKSDAAGLAAGALLALSLSGYGVYALCLPRGTDDLRPKKRWAVWGCGALAAVLLVCVGVFGPALTAQMDEPVLLLLEGGRGAGLLSRGAVALAAVLALADLTLLALLIRGCGALWRGLVPAAQGRGLWLLAAAAFWAAGVLPEDTAQWWARGVPVGNLLFGALIPALAILTRKQDGTEQGLSTSCGESGS